MEIHRHAEFLDNSHFLILDKLIHGCKSRECKRKLMAKGKDVKIKNCLEIMRKFEAVEVTMKKLEDVGDAHVDASYARDPTKKSQRDGFKKKQLEPKLHQNSQKPDEKKSCVWCEGNVRPREKCPAKDATCKDTLNEHVLRKRDKAKDPNTNMLSISQLNKTIVI